MIKRSISMQRYCRLALIVMCTVGALPLQSCGTLMRRNEAVPAPTHTSADFPLTIRSLAPDGQFTTISSADLARRLRAIPTTGVLNVLALSGGGAGGAFGAGALVGLTSAGSRPTFDIVTGVSVGAFIAPFAFLGSDWDAQLSEAYAIEQSQRLLKSRGLGAIFGSSLYRNAPLIKLVNDFVSDTMVRAVAREARKGRLLLVATTDLDTEETVIWDMGAIAMNGGSEALTLFRGVLVASASPPGMLPPVMLRVNDGGASHDEMHVDGGLTVPFFIFPNLGEMLPDARTGLRGARVYILVDGPLASEPRNTPARTSAILSRSVATALQRMLTTNLELASATTRMHAMTLKVSAVPVAYPFGGAFNFRARTMDALFNFAHECARAGRLWTDFGGAPAQLPSASSGPRVHDVKCPGDRSTSLPFGASTTADAPSENSIQLNKH